MTNVFRVDRAQYDVDALSDAGRTLIERLNFAQQKMQELSNQQALLTKAKNAYIAELKIEIVKARSGVDLTSLLSDD